MLELYSGTTLPQVQSGILSAQNVALMFPKCSAPLLNYNSPKKSPKRSPFTYNTSQTTRKPVERELSIYKENDMKKDEMTSNTPKIDENPPAPPQRSQAPRDLKN